MGAGTNERMPYGGRRVWTSNWVPSVWSVREMWPGDNYHLALAYFQTGLAEDGWDILRGTYLESMYAGPVPGNLGHKVGGIDFNDCSSMFCQPCIEGVFGYTPDYPNGRVQIAPQFPAGMGPRVDPHPRFRVEVPALRAGDSSEWDVELGECGSGDFVLPLRAGRSRRFRSMGDHGVGSSSRALGGACSAYDCRRASLQGILVSIEAPLPAPLPAVTLTANVGEKIKCMVPAGRLLSVEDPRSAGRRRGSRGYACRARSTRESGRGLRYSDACDWASWNNGSYFG